MDEEIKKRNKEKTMPDKQDMPKGAAGTIGPSEQKICLWTEDEDGDWSTACGETFTLFEGTPKENYYNYCPNCGQKILEKPVDVFDEKEE